MAETAIGELWEEQLSSWKTAQKNYAALADVRTKTLDVHGVEYKVQFNPARVVSSGAKTDAKSISGRKCFLCPSNLPPEQKGVPFLGHYQILVNPFPIFRRHLTIPELSHTKQRIAPRFGDMLMLAKELADYTVFYNGPECGASAPDHAHFQAGNKGFMPIERQWESMKKQAAAYGAANLWYLDDSPRTAFVIESFSPDDACKAFSAIYRSLGAGRNGEEPMMNILAQYENGRWVIIVFPRKKHRPDCYYAEGGMLVSPASVDMGGVFIAPIEKDFIAIGAKDIEGILSEVSYSGTDFKRALQQVKTELTDKNGTDK